MQLAIDQVRAGNLLGNNDQLVLNGTAFDGCDVGSWQTAQTNAVAFASDPSALVRWPCVCYRAVVLLCR